MMPNKKRKVSDTRREEEEEEDEVVPSPTVPVSPGRNAKKKHKVQGPPAPPVHHGETNCKGHRKDGSEWPKRAYYGCARDGQVFCGVHVRKQAGKFELPKDPDAKRKREVAYQQHLGTVNHAREQNASAGRPGTLSMCRMRMMRNPPLVPGVLNVFPNYKHAHRKDGFGCPSLSPKAMGPVEHGQPGLPPAKSIENAHQGNKVFPFLAPGGTPHPAWYHVRRGMYEDNFPYRHQLAFVEKNRENIPGLKDLDIPTVRVNAPLYSIWVQPDGTEKRLSYVESRQVYCHFYEQFARENNDFARLRELLQGGTNLCIVGYDAKDGVFSCDDLATWYLDPSHPFGHEAVLATLLLQPNPKLFPWRVHQTVDLPGAPLPRSEMDVDD